MDFKNEILENLPAYGLAAVMLLAGLSKFAMPSLWTGFEPQIIVETVGLTARQLMYAGGVFEALLGIVIIYEKTRSKAALATAIWLSAITLRTVQLGAYSIAIRDFGLVMYAVTVYSLTRS